MQAIERALYRIGITLTLIIFVYGIFGAIRSNKPLLRARAPLWSASFLSNEEIMTVSGASDPNPPISGEVNVLDLRSHTKRTILKTDFPARAVAASRNGFFVAVGDFGGSVYIMNISNGRIVKKLQCSGPVNAVAWSRNGDLLAVCTLGGEIFFYNLKTGRIDRLLIAGQVILNIAIGAGEHFLAFTTRSGKVYLVGLPSLVITKELDLFDDRMRESNAEALAFSPDGAVLWTGCDKYVRSLDLKTMQVVTEFSLDAKVNSLAVSSDGESLAAIDSTGVLCLWDSTTGKLRFAKRAHNGIAVCVTFSPDDHQLATVGREDFTIKIWDLLDSPRVVDSFSFGN